jgi:hypothetical protein
MFRVTNAWPHFGHVHRGRPVRCPGGRTVPPTSCATTWSTLRFLCLRPCVIDEAGQFPPLRHRQLNPTGACGHYFPALAVRKEPWGPP